MRNLMRRLGMALAALGLIVLSTDLASAAPTIMETTSGTSGDYTLDFSVTNNLGGTNGIYFFGVLLDSGRDITGSPGLFDPNAIETWSNAAYGGSSTIYNNVWIDETTVGIQNGDTLGGFKVHSTDLSLPASIQWFAYSFYPDGGAYQGTDNFNAQWNPGFEGTVGTGTAVPEPSTLLVGVASLLAGGLVRYLRRSESLAQLRSRG
jgi:hypothetical protein